MAISDADFDRIMGAAHPEEDSSPPAVSDNEFNAILGKQPAQPQGGTFKSFAKGAVQGFATGPVSNAIHGLEADYPSVMGVLNQGGLDSVYGEGFSAETTTDQQRRGMIQAHNASVKSQFLSKYYLDVDDQGHTVANAVGQMIGALADPSTLAATAVKGATITARVLSGGKIGAAWGAAQAATEDYATQGDVDPSHVAAGAALGAVAGSALQGVAVEPLRKLVERFKARGNRVAAGDVEEALKHVTDGQGDTVDSTALADEINVQAGTNELTPEMARNGAIVDNITKQDNIDPREIDRAYLEGKADEMLKGRPLGNEPIELTKAPSENNPPTTTWSDDPTDRQMLEAQTFIDSMKETPDLQKDIIRQTRNAYKKMETSMTGGEDVAVLETIKGEHVPASSPIGNGMDPPDIGIDFDNPTPGDHDGIVKKVFNIWDLGRPDKIFRHLGEVGERAGRDLTVFKEMQKQELAARMVSYKRVMIDNKITKEQEALIPDINRNLVDKSEIPTNVLKAANDLKQLFGRELGEHVAKGIISHEEAAQLIADANKKGWWHRVFNQTLLNTVDGSKAFVKAVSEHPFMSEQKAKASIKSLLGQKNLDKMTNYVRTRTTAQGKTEYFIDPAISEHIWAKSKQIPKSGKSFVELQRHFPEEMEATLKPFLINDTEASFEHYMQSSTSRISAATVFGKNHEGAVDIFKQMHAMDKGTALLFRDTFWGTMKDPRNEAIQSFMNKPEWLSDASRILKAFNVFKLTFSQIKNATQLPINGAVYVAGLKGVPAFDKLKIFARGLHRAYSGKMGRFGNKLYLEQAQEAGAVNNSFTLEILGKINDDANTIAGRRLFGPLEIVNNPTEFLKRTGFNFVEDANRIGGFHIGKGAIESLLNQRVKFEEALVRGPDPTISKQLETVLSQLEELGISRAYKVDQVTVRMIKDGAYKIQAYGEDLAKAVARGGQRVANEINFVNDAHKLPQFFQSFWGKMLLQLKTFAYHQTHFVIDHVLTPARQGNFAPAMIYLGVGTPLGMTTNEFYRFVVGDDSEMTGLERVVKGQLALAGFGMVQDAIVSASYGKQGVYGFMFGPTAAAVADVTQGSVGAYNVLSNNYKKHGSILKGDDPLQPVEKAVLRQLSFPGKAALLSKMQADRSALQGKIDRRMNKGFSLEEVQKRQQQRLKKMGIE